MNSSSGAMI